LGRRLPTPAAALVLLMVRTRSSVAKETAPGSAL